MFLPPLPLTQSRKFENCHLKPQLFPPICSQNAGNSKKKTSENLDFQILRGGHTCTPPLVVMRNATAHFSISSMCPCHPTRQTVVPTVNAASVPKCKNTYQYATNRLKITAFSITYGLFPSAGVMNGSLHKSRSRHELQDRQITCWKMSSNILEAFQTWWPLKTLNNYTQ